MQSNGRTKDVATVFWKRVDRSGGDKACWPWMGYRNDNGYGNVKINNHRASTHRLAYELAIGEIPSGLFICHHCDNPACCNPAHLYAGTIAQNTRDAVSRGRYPSGERNGSAKLSGDDIDMIRKLHDQGMTQTGLARRFGVSHSAIARHVHGRGKVWNMVGEHNPSTKITPDIVRQIRQRRLQGEKLLSIAADFGISKQSVCGITKRREWKHVD